MAARSIVIPIASATSVASASEITVTCLGSTSGAPPISIRFSTKVPSSVTTGIVSAGMNSRLPQRFALASRSSSRRHFLRALAEPAECSATQHHRDDENAVRRDR